MPGERLTRAELGWLLAQEARGAASALRAEVKELRASLSPPALEQPEGQALPPPAPVIRWVDDRKSETPASSGNAVARASSSTSGPRSERTADASEDRISALPGERHLNVLDEAIDLLATLQQPTGPKSKRRGRIDLASLLYDLAPNCRLSIEPGAGTEVIGDEHELRRMFHLLLNQQTGGSGDGATLNTIEIRRQNQWVHVSVELGPDTAAANDLERRWLSRMAVKHGGRLELHGRRQQVILPAESSNQEEVDQLKRELEQAQLLGEVYARELATALSHESSIPPKPGTTAPVSAPQIAAPGIAMATIASILVPMLNAVSREAHAGGALSPATLELVDTLKGQFQYVLAGHEPARRVDLVELLQQVTASGNERGSKRGVRVLLEPAADAPEQQENSGAKAMTVSSSPRTLNGLLTLLVDHGISATPTGGTVKLTVLADNPDGIALRVADQGPAIPQSLIDGLLAGSVDPASVGRPSGPALLIATHLGNQLGATLRLGSDAEHALVDVLLPR